MLRLLCPCFPVFGFLCLVNKLVQIRAVLVSLSFRVGERGRGRFYESRDAPEHLLQPRPAVAFLLFSYFHAFRGTKACTEPLANSSVLCAQPGQGREHKTEHLPPPAALQSLRDCTMFCDSPLCPPYLSTLNIRSPPEVLLEFLD